LNDKIPLLGVTRMPHCTHIHSLIGRLGRLPLMCCVILAVVSCTATPSYAPLPSSRSSDGHSVHSKTFAFTGGPQIFNVPSGVTHVTITAFGAGSKGARGGRVKATIPVLPGEPLTIFVGGEAAGSTGGFNGGG